MTRIINNLFQILLHSVRIPDILVILLSEYKNRADWALCYLLQTIMKIRGQFDAFGANILHLQFYVTSVSLSMARTCSSTIVVLTWMLPSSIIENLVQYCNNPPHFHYAVQC